MTDKLFVYGTLRSDIENGRFRDLLAGEARFLGRGRIEGRLLDLGNYPGCVPGRGSRLWVRGEVYALHGAGRALSRLDDYEGCGPADPEPRLFERAEADVLLESGVRDRAWLYAYIGPTAGKREIPSGDYGSEARREGRTS